MTEQGLTAAADDLLAHLDRLGPSIRAVRRVIHAPAEHDQLTDLGAASQQRRRLDAVEAWQTARENR